jgi:hypothetical protein
MDHNRAYKLGRAFRLGLAFSLGKQHQQGMAMDRWITIHPFGKGKNADYARIFINDDTGVIETGAGGRFNGKTLKEAFSKENAQKKAEQQAKLPSERKEVDIVKRKRGFDMKDADSVSEKFKDAFNAAIGNANSRMDYEMNGQPAFQKALETLPEGTVFVNGSDTDYYIKENGQWLKRSYDDPDRMTTTDVTEPPSFGDTDINGKWLFGIGGSLKQAEANKKMHQMFGIKKPSNGGEGSKTFSRGQKFYERYAQKYNVDSWDAGIYADKKLLDEASKGNIDFVLGFAKSHNEKKLGYRDLEHYELMAIARKNGQSYRHGLNGIDPSSKAELLKGTIDYLKEANYPQSYIDERITNFKNDLNHSAKHGFVKNLKAKLYDENGNKRDYSFIGGIEHDDLMNKAVKAKYANDLEKDYASGYLRDDNYFAQLERDVPSESNRLHRKENKLRKELAELMMKRDLVGSERVKGIENAIENKNKEINETYAKASDAYKKEVSDLENEVITKAAKTKYTRAVFTDNKYGEERNGYETQNGAQIEKVSSGWRIKVDGRQYYADTITAAKRVVAVCDIFKEKGMSDNNVNQDKWLKSAITRFTGRY